MKICPRCQRTYTDDNLNFCLEDGVVLQQAGGQQDPPATVFMNQPPPTDLRTAGPTTQPTVQPQWNTAPQQYGGPPKKSSKAWIWVLLILGVVVIGCGTLSVVGLYLLGKSNEGSAANTTATNTKTTANTKSSSNALNSNNATFPSNSSTTASPDNRTNVEDVDLSALVMENSSYGNTSYSGNELTMSSKKNDSYYVIVTKNMGYVTEGANTRVTLSNRDNANSSMGYGLIFHSNPTPLMQDYAFLIDTKKKRYRIARHTPGDESEVISWTSSNAIKDGSQENVLEVRDKPNANKVELYINDQLVNTIQNTYGYKHGVPGLYTGGTAPIVFKDMQVSK